VKSTPRARSPIERITVRLLSAAIDLCAADVDVQTARRQRRDLALRHGSEGICCAIRMPVDIEEVHDPVPNVPKSRWCKHCQRFARTAIHYQDALFARRSAKTRMKRAYLELLAVEQQLSTGREFMAKYRDTFRALAR
jgi:hypothetical protein